MNERQRFEKLMVDEGLDTCREISQVQRARWESRRVLAERVWQAALSAATPAPPNDLIDRLELSLSVVPADQPNCAICDRTLKIIEEWRDSVKGEGETATKEVMSSEAGKFRPNAVEGEYRASVQTSASAPSPEELAREIHAQVCEGLLSHDCEPEIEAVAALLRARLGERQ